MSLWGNEDSAANSPKFGPAQVNRPNTSGNITALFSNTSPNVWQNGTTNMSKVVGSFGVSTDEVANTSGEGNKVPHAGWNLRTAGLGALDSVVVTSAGASYANTNTFVIVNSVGANATGNVVTNATGNVVSVNITEPGGLFNTTSPTLTITTGTGSGAVLSPVVGGRAGRVQFETIVAMGSMTGDGSDDAILP